MTPAVVADDLLLDSLGSAIPPVLPTDWELENLLQRWCEAVDSKPMPEWVTA
jgi:hypothetical protein